jgi:hypothetical protein
MKLVGGRGKSQLGKNKTQKDVTNYFNSFPRLGIKDFP